MSNTMSFLKAAKQFKTWLTAKIMAREFWNSEVIHAFFLMEQLSMHSILIDKDMHQESQKKIFGDCQRTSSYRMSMSIHKHGKFDK
jgi:hypothetical protein